ncbi:hypothetical protein EI94DRAFT_1739600 [Lactarius quietus]|nr:hypothetical protein EI94DRAFT_1739600 [Lactarius quietus]
MQVHHHIYAEIASTISSVSDDISRDRLSGRLWRNLTRRQIRRGEQYMDGSHRIFQLSRPFLNRGDKVVVRSTFKRARDARAKLDNSRMSIIRKYYGARMYKRLCRETFEVVMVSSRRVLEDSLLETSDGIYPPAGASPANQEEPDGTRPSGGTGSVTPTHENQAGAPPMTPTHSIFQPGPSPANPKEPDRARPSGRTGSVTPTHENQAGTPPMTPREPDRTDPPAGAPPPTSEGSDSPLPYDRRSAVSYPAATSSIAEWAQNVETTPSESSEAAGIVGPVDVDEVSDSFSFIYDPSMATSGTTISSYKTEKTVISTKSRYNKRPRHKYADHGYLRPQGFDSLAVDNASIAETELSEEHDEPPSSPPPTPTVSPKPESSGDTAPHGPTPELPAHGRTGGAEEGESSNVDQLDRS